MTEARTKLLAWEGIACEIPAEWSPTVLSGTRSKGFLRISDLEAIRMEIRWEPARGAWDPDAVVSRYGSLLRKAARKNRIDLVIRREDVGEEAAENAGAALVVEEPRAVSYHRLERWDDGRVVFARVETRPRRDRRLARRILVSLSSSVRDARETWAVFGLTLHVAAGWKRAEHRLSTGVLQLGLTRGRRRIVVEQQSLGTQLVRDRGLDGFLDTVARSTEMSAGAGERRVVWRGHDAPARTGRGKPPRRKKKYRSLAGMVARGLTRRHSTVVCAWHCEMEDKVFAVKGFGWERPEELLEELGVECHAEVRT